MGWGNPDQKQKMSHLLLKGTKADVCYLVRISLSVLKRPSCVCYLYFISCASRRANNSIWNVSVICSVTVNLNRNSFIRRWTCVSVEKHESCVAYCASVGSALYWQRCVGGLTPSERSQQPILSSEDCVKAASKWHVISLFCPCGGTCGVMEWF